MARVRVGQFRLRAYRSCKNTVFQPEPRLSALIGPNGSGKTNVLHGFLLLRDFRRRYLRDRDDLFTLKCEIEATFVVSARPVLYRASVIFRPTERNRDDVIQSKERFNFKSIDGKNQWIDPQESFLMHGRIASKVLRSALDRSVPGRVVRTPDGRYMVYAPGKGEPVIPEGKVSSAFEAIQDFRSGIAYYSASQFTNPSWCPTSFEIDSDGDLRFVSDRGTDHIRFMYDLHDAYENKKEEYSKYMSLVGKDGLNLIDKITWKRSTVASNTYEVRSGGTIVKKQRGTVLIIPTVYSGKTQLSFNQLSEGTFRSLAMLFYIITGKSSLLLIEEPEVCVHHGLLASFVEIIKQCSRHRQVIVSTHSDYVIDRLKPENVFLVSNYETRGTTVKAISRSMSRGEYAALKHYLNTAGNLGEYWRQSGFQS